MGDVPAQRKQTISPSEAICRAAMEEPRTSIASIASVASNAYADPASQAYVEEDAEAKVTM